MNACAYRRKPIAIRSSPISSFLAWSSSRSLQHAALRRRCKDNMRPCDGATQSVAIN